MTEVKIPSQKEKLEIKKAETKKEAIEPALIIDMADKVGYLWQIMNEHTDALNMMRKQLDQVRTRMGL